MTSSSLRAPRADENRSTARHRSPGPVPRAELAGPAALVLAVLASASAVVLTLTGQRSPAIVVGAVGLALAVGGLLLGRAGRRVRRGSGRPGR